MHLPMIDFATSDSAMALAVTRSLLHELHLPEPYLFSSGRSFHGYCPVLLSADSWRIFMGALLLLNPDSGREVVDHRWVGHRLMAGYGALRWSWNTDQYVSYPGPRLANRPAFRRIAPNE